MDEYAVFSMDINGYINSWTKGAERLLGYKEDEISGQNISLIFTKEDRDNNIPQMELKNSLTFGRGKDERIHVKKDGSIFWADGYVFPLKMDQKIIGFVKIMRDLTEKKDYEESLKESEEKFRLLIEKSDDAIILLDKQGKCSYATLGVKRILGYSQKDFMNIDFRDLINKEDLKFVTDKYTKVLKEPGKSVTSWFRIKDIENKWKWVECITTNLLEEKGVNLVVNNLRDITIRKEIEQKFKEQAQLLQSTQDAFIVQDSNNVILSWNKGSELLYGWKEEEVIGKKASKILNTKFPVNLKDIHNRILTKGFWEGELLHMTKDGKEITVESHWEIVQVDNKHNNFLEVNRDITEKKKLQMQKDDFIGIASHELKTPVTSIKAYTQILERRFRKSGNFDAAELLNKMDSQINKLTDLIGDLLDVTKIESGRLKLELEFFDFNKLIREIIEEIQFSNPNHKFNLIGNIAFEVKADKNRIHQVIINLISNAIKYSPNSNEINIYLDHDKTNVKLCVQDFGTGISKEKQDKVFDRFYRISGPGKETFPGLGLGLYISSEIIKRQGGKIWVESIEGKGSTFCFQIPKDVTKHIININEKIMKENN